MSRFRRHAAICTFLVMVSSSFAAKDPRNIILIIGDGFDDQHVTMGRTYLKGAAGELLLDTMPLRGALHIETVNSQQQPVYVADSANTATTIATGVVTEIGRVGTGPDDSDAQTIAEIAIANGLRAGIVSTASITDATPASFVAHVNHRSCENPIKVMGSDYYGTAMVGCPQDAAQNGGPGSIAEQMARSGMTVILGGGRGHFETPLATHTSITPLTLARDNGFTVLNDFPAGDGERLLGLFADKHLPVRWQGTDGRIAESAIDRKVPEPIDCEPNPAFGDTPSLAAMTEVALDALTNERGFFLMIESASIDKQAHARNPCGSLGEIEQLEEALQLALDYAALHPETLVVVTADHAQAAQIIPEPTLYREGAIPADSPGRIARIRTPEGSMMRINYATDVDYSENHTGAHVPLYANAAGAHILRPFMRQRELHAAMLKYLELLP